MKNILFSLILIFPLIGFGQNLNNLYDDYFDALDKGKTKKAHRVLNKISKIETNTFLTLLKTASYYGEVENADSAELYLFRAMEYHRYSPISSTGEDYFKKRDSLFNEAIKIFDWLIETQPKVEYYTDLLMIKLNLGRNEEALPDAKKAVGLEPGEAVHYYNLGLAYSRLSKLDSSLLSYNKALEIDDQYADAYLNKGFIYIKKDSFKLAIQQFSYGLQFNGDMGSKSFTLNNMGYCYYKLSKLKAAKNFIEQSLEMNPLNSYAYKNLALVEIAYGKKNAACKAIDQALELGFTEDYGDEVLELKKSNCD